MSGSAALAKGASDVQEALVKVGSLSMELLSKNVDALKTINIGKLCS